MCHPILHQVQVQAIQNSEYINVENKGQCFGHDNKFTITLKETKQKH